MNRRNVSRPQSLRTNSTAALTAAVAATALGVSVAHAQEAEVQLGTLKVKERAADTNPYSEEGAPYKAKVSGDIRRVKPLAETPNTITVVTETQIKEAGLSDLREILDQQPGVTIGTGENGNAFGDRYIIRGQEARSDVFVDGLRDPGMTIRESFALEQVELTKGPSSSFAGRGSAGGAVNGVTKRASTEYNFNKAELSVGTDEHIRATLDSNWALSEKFALRANLLYAYEEVPDRDPADRERWGAAVSGLFNVSDSVQLLLDYYHLDAEDRPDMGGYLGTDGPVDDVPAYAQKEDFLKSRVDTVTARVIVTPFEGFTLQNSTRYGTTDNGYVVTGYRGTTLSTHQGWQDVEYFVNQLNLRGDFNTGSVKHSLIAGAEYSDHQVVNGVYDWVAQGTPNRGTGYAITNPDGTYLDNISTLMQRKITKGDADSRWNVETLSVYLMDTADITNWLSLFGGVRFDSLTYRNTVINVRTGAKTPYGYSQDLWNGHAGIAVKPAENGNIYFSWGTAKDVNGGESDLGSSCGYGGVCVPSSVGIIDYGKPESVRNLELGTKWELFDNKLLLTAALFHIRKSDVFEQASGNNGYEQTGTLNTGKNRVRGIELGFAGNITDRLSGQAGVTFMKSRVLASNNPANVGGPLSNFANKSATAQLRYQATEAFSFGGTVTYQGKMRAGQPDSPGTDTRVVPDFTVFDLFATYKINEQFNVRLNVGNVTDKDYYLATYRSGSFLYKGDERTFRLSLGARF